MSIISILLVVVSIIFIVWFSLGSLTQTTTSVETDETARQEQETDGENISDTLRGGIPALEAAKRAKDSIESNNRSTFELESD